MIIRQFKIEDIHNGLLETLQSGFQINTITEDSITRWINNSNWMIVAEEDGTIIGSCTLHLNYKLIHDGGIVGMIEDVVVRGEHRGKNIGTLMIQEALKLSKELGCYKVILSCFMDKVEFYTKCGFREEAVTMRFDI